MGREAELLEAARAGQRQQVERLLQQRARLSGPLASLRRGPGANVQDSSGYTPLHHASLNGHQDIVQLLLNYDASPNILDSKGSSPLHLAAWAGHTGIVRLLLSHGPTLTNVNLTTRDNESALHCAAQYGHTAVVAMLLQHGADPTIRSAREETALDLASQYGRLETVELLVRTHPELLEIYRNPRGILPHTPLHRASKNGHKAVVVVLLKAGHNVNACTPSGAALHEAALCGKLSVAKALLARGADPRVRDRAGDTVLDVLARFPPHVTHEIVTLINQYRMSNGFDSETEELPRIPVHQHDGLNSPYDNVPSNNRHIWERREGEDERRVSGTSAISITNNELPLVKHKIKPKPNPVLLFASKCFGAKPKYLTDSDMATLPYRKNPNKNESKTGDSGSPVSSPSSTRVGQSSFHRSLSVTDLDSTKKDVPVGYPKERPKVSTAVMSSLPNIFESVEESSNRSDSLNSLLSITNSIYGELGECSPSSLDNIDTVLSQDDTGIVNDNNSNAGDKNKSASFKKSHSIRTLRNWTANNDSFKNSNPVYQPEMFPDQSVGKNKLYYAHLDFNGVQSHNRLKDIHNTDYEIYDFKESGKIDKSDGTFKPIVSDDNDQGTIFSKIRIQGGDDGSQNDANTRTVDRLVLRKMNKSRVGRCDNSLSDSSDDSIADETSNFEDMGLKCASWQLSSFDISDPSTHHEAIRVSSNDTADDTKPELDTKENPALAYRSSAQSEVEDDYLPMNAVLCFSKDDNEADRSNDYSITTLRQIYVEDDPVYQNMVFPKDVKSRDIASPTPINSAKTAYHIRGSDNCIYEKPYECDYVYVFNRESIGNTEVPPFMKVHKNTTIESDIRNFCFCSANASNAIDATNDQVIGNGFKSKVEPGLSITDSFICYCCEETCKLHYTKAFDRFNVLFDPSKLTVSLPDFIDGVADEIKSPEYVYRNRRKSSYKVKRTSSLTFFSVRESQLFSANLKRHSDSDLNRRSSNVFNFDVASNGATDHYVSCVCCSTLEGGGSLCVYSGSDGGHYPYSKSSVMDGSYHSEELSSSYQSGKVREPDQLSISSTTSSTGGPSPRERQRCGTNESSVSGQGIYMSMGSSSGYHAHSPGSNSKVSPTPPKKPPRRNLSVSPTHLLPPGGVPDSGALNERSHHLVRTGQTRSQDDLDEFGPGSKHSGLRHGRSVDQYVDSKVSPRTKPVPQPRPSLTLLAARRDQPVAINTMYENVVIKEQNPRRKLRRNNPNQYENYHPKEINNAGAGDDDTYARSKNQKHHSSQEKSSLESLLDDVGSYHGGTPSDGEYRNDRSNQQTPLSPTHYNQPPTPDHPPPSARQAEMSIHERIRPLSQEYKRMSRDMETETDPRFLARSSSPASSASTDHCVEEYVAEVPFAGLFKGSTTTLDGICSRPVPAERPKSLRKLKTVYDNGGQGVMGSGGGVIRVREIPPGTRIDPDVDPWQYRHKEDKDQHSSNASSAASIDKPLSLLSPFDEQEEWAKINEIMASFGSRIVRESVFAEELEQEFQTRLGARFSCSESSLSPSVPPGPPIFSWLSGLGLQNLESNFTNNGFDHIDFINGVIEDNDLAEMAIEEPEKSKVLESCKTLPTKIHEIVSVTTNNHNNNINNNNSDKENENDPEAVNKWLSSIGLECYQDTFRRHLYTDMERVRRIWEVELTAVLEIQKVGHRRRILASVSGRQNGPINNLEDIADLNTLERNIQTLKAEIKEKLPENHTNNHVTNHSQEQVVHGIVPHAKPGPGQSILAPANSQNQSTPNQLTTPAPGGETLKRSHKKNRPPPPPPTRGADLEIRAPCALMVGVPGTTCTQWKHQPLVLVTGSVMYVANYLGSTIVKELRGKESTQKSIQKLKKTNNEPRALPDIILSISYRGVKFLNTITRELVCEHEIRNIHLACQDADDLTHFAYITKDITTKSHYCHVFCVATMDQATEVILTLGQAFEVAYQMALRDSAMKSNTNTLQPPGQVRSQSSNQISQQAKTPTHEKNANNNTKDRPNPIHGRSHSVTEIKLNGHQLKVAPITVSISNEDFQAVARNGDVQKSPRTPSSKAPIAVAEEI